MYKIHIFFLKSYEKVQILEAIISLVGLYNAFTKQKKLCAVPGLLGSTFGRLSLLFITVSSMSVRVVLVTMKHSSYQPKQSLPAHLQYKVYWSNQLVKQLGQISSLKLIIKLQFKYANTIFLNFIILFTFNVGFIVNISNLYSCRLLLLSRFIDKRRKERKRR